MTAQACHGAADAAPSTEGGVVLVGNPNTGKSTLFNALTGGGASVGNYAGTTVDVLEGALAVPGIGPVIVRDVPGTWSLAARSPEERIAIDAVLGLRGRPAPAALVVIADSVRLARSLYLVLQLLELRVPVVVALNLLDEARAAGRVPDAAALEAALGVPVVPVVARTGEGLDALRGRVAEVLVDPARHVPGCPHAWSEPLLRDAAEIVAALPEPLRAASEGNPDRERALALWLLLSVDDDEALEGDPDVPRAAIARVRARARGEGRDLDAEIVGQRWQWIDAREAGFVRGIETRGAHRAERIDRVLMHPVWGTAAFLAVMTVVFEALFAWSDPAIGAIEAAFGWLGGRVGAAFDAWAPSAGILRDLLVDGVIGGVGSVLVFLPQIALLFLFLALLEDCGYLARAAQLVDRLLRAAGLPGQAFVPLLSGFACAVPAILATRTMPRFRDRLLTMMVIPLTSCSARLPVYALVIATMFPAAIPGFPFALRPAVLLGIYLFSTAVTLAAALVLGRLVVPERATPTLLELPPYRVPHPATVLRAVTGRVGDFVREAGGIILVATLVLWALLYFPRYAPEDLLPPDVLAAHTAEEQEALAAPLAIERSFAGRIGKAMEPALAPLGYDWRVGVGLVGAFAAREVFVATMGVVYGIGDADEESTDLRERIRGATRADGSPAYTPLVGVSLMVFFALAMQCTSTLAVLRRETGGWGWPLFIFGYMNALAWTSAAAVYQIGHWLGFT